jgi:predicted dehydrogenase
VAVVGIGNRGNRVLKSLSGGMTNIVALCDADLGAGHTVGSLKAHPDAKQYQDFRVMFDEMGDEIDAVGIATPDHSHFCIAMHAMALGKHVYVEKPLAHDFQQCELLMKMAEKSGVVTQMGNQGHSGPNYFQWKTYTEEGVIKNVNKIMAYMNKDRRWYPWGDIQAYPDQPVPETMDWNVWLATAEEHPFSGKLHPGDWRGWYDYGTGVFGDWGAHLLDTAHEFLHLGLPEKVEAVMLKEPNDLIYPKGSVIRFSFPARGSEPPVTLDWYDGQGNQPERIPEMGENERFEIAGKIIQTTDGDVWKGGSHSAVVTLRPVEKWKDIREDLPEFDQGKGTNHFKNFLKACKGEEETRSPFRVAAPLSQVFTLGCLSQRFGGAFEFDREKKQIIGNDAANALLSPPPRKGWEEYYRMVG